MIDQKKLQEFWKKTLRKKLPFITVLRWMVKPANEKLAYSRFYAKLKKNYLEWRDYESLFWVVYVKQKVLFEILTKIS